MTADTLTAALIAAKFLPLAVGPYCCSDWRAYVDITEWPGQETIVNRLTKQKITLLGYGRDMQGHYLLIRGDAP